MLDKVLILSASAGAGHVRAAEALQRAVEAGAAAREVRHVDALQYTNKLFRRLYSKAYIDLVNTAPTLMGWLYQQTDKPWKNERVRLALDKLNTRPLIKLLKEFQPNVAICTHFLPAEIIAYLKRKGKLSCPLAVVVTDFDVHAMWLARPVDDYFVALDETREILVQLGIARESIHVTGIPIDPLFAEPMDQRAARRELKLDEERTTILVSAGGFGVGNVELLAVGLAQLKHPAQVVAICGRNEKLASKLTRAVAKLDHQAQKFHVVGFTTQMHQYMAAADMLVGKPGGLTTSEALARGLVFVVVNPIPGQEERNADHLLEEGAAIRCNNPPTLAYKIDRLLADPAHMKELRHNARRLSRPRAACEIVETLVQKYRRD